MVEEHSDLLKKLEELRASIQVGQANGQAQSFDADELVERIKNRGRERLSASNPFGS